MEWYKKCFSQYADFTGRARRKEYWMFSLFNFIALILVGILGFSLDSMFNLYGLATNILIIIYCLGMIVPSLAVTVRRLHDIDRTGWWLLLSIIPFGSIVLFIFSVLDGTNGDNTYGPSPK